MNTGTLYINPLQSGTAFVTRVQALLDRTYCQVHEQIHEAWGLPGQTVCRLCLNFEIVKLMERLDWSNLANTFLDYMAPDDYDFTKDIIDGFSGDDYETVFYLSGLIAATALIRKQSIDELITEIKASPPGASFPLSPINGFRVLPK